MNDFTFISFAGRDRVGKTTTAKRLVSELSKKYENSLAVLISLGHFLRVEINEMYGIPYSYMTTYEGKNKVIRLGDFKYNREVLILWYKTGKVNNIFEFENTEIKIRDLMIFHGTDIRRSENPSYWPNQMDKYIKRMKRINKDFNKKVFIVNDDPREETDFLYLINDCKAQMFCLTNHEHPLDDNVYSNRSEQRAMTFIKDNIDKFIHFEVPIPADDFDINKVIISLSYNKEMDHEQFS